MYKACITMVLKPEKNNVRKKCQANIAHEHTCKLFKNIYKQADSSRLDLIQEYKINLSLKII